jgi:phage-related protein
MPDQKWIRLIHTLKSKLALSDDDYRAMLSSYNKTSSTSLSDSQAKELTQTLTTMAVKRGVWKKPAGRSYKRKWDELGDRPGMASPAQLRKLEVMWSKVSRQPDAESRSEALVKFVMKITGVSQLDWMEPVHVRKVIRAIEAMQRQGLTDQYSRRSHEDQ